MELHIMLLLLCLLLSINSIEAFNIDTIQQWNDSQLICGFPVSSLKSYDWEQIFEEEFALITRNQTFKPYKIHNQTRRIIISYDDFLCCLKTVWISVKNSFQKQKCLKYFMKCVKSTEREPCLVPWTYYVNLAVHDLRVATMLVITSAIFFVTSVILVEKCKKREYDSFLES